MTDIFLALAMSVAPATWQDAQLSNQTPATQTSEPAKTMLPPAPPAAPMSLAEREARRDNISLMESLLARAVFVGARKVQQGNPGVVLMATGQPRARGFVLDGYGTFFDVEIPELQGSMELTMQQLQRELGKSLAERTGSEANSSGPRRTSSAQNIPAADDTDPSAPYREAVILACTEAMLDYSKNLSLQPGEWLTVALRGSEATATQMEIRDSRTVILRLRGSDLGDYLASRISKNEAVKRERNTSSELESAP
jgi:hypothetical protein